MAPYAPEPESNGARRQTTIAAAAVVLALATTYLPEGSQQRIALSMQASLLRPFIATQELLADARLRAGRIEDLRGDLDSLTAVASTQSALVDENRTLRELLQLSERAGPSYLPATVLRPGTPGSESMFLVDVGSDDGVQTGAPVVGPHGLVGQVREVRPRSAVAMDWTHPDFRVSAMLIDGSVFGIVENVRGLFRELDRLVLNGTAFNESVPEGSLVVTSGLGGVFPRGIPVGAIESTAEVEGSWRKSYWLRPMVQPGSATHVLVASSRAAGDVGDLWPDSTPALEEAGERGPES